MKIAISSHKHYGVQLRAAREFFEISQKELAKRTGTSSSNLSHFEKGDNTRGNGSLDTAVRYARGLGADELIIKL